MSKGWPIARRSCRGPSRRMSAESSRPSARRRASSKSARIPCAARWRWASTTSARRWRTAPSWSQARFATRSWKRPLPSGRTGRGGHGQCRPADRRQHRQCRTGASARAWAASKQALAERADQIRLVFEDVDRSLASRVDGDRPGPPAMAGRAQTTSANVFASADERMAARADDIVSVFASADERYRRPRRRHRRCLPRQPTKESPPRAETTAQMLTSRIGDVADAFKDTDIRLGQRYTGHRGRSSRDADQRIIQRTPSEFRGTRRPRPGNRAGARQCPNTAYDRGTAAFRPAESTSTSSSFGDASAERADSIARTFGRDQPADRTRQPGCRRVDRQHHVASPGSPGGDPAPFARASTRPRAASTPRAATSPKTFLAVDSKLARSAEQAHCPHRTARLRMLPIDSARVPRPSASG